ncbi:hypothetical protein G6F63_015444 [Rhizopus arrhizus]|nr:hypothetical protein G6F63_015444 [Rhizopus arrhizus]
MAIWLAETLASPASTHTGRCCIGTQPWPGTLTACSTKRPSARVAVQASAGEGRQASPAAQTLARWPKPTALSPCACSTVTLRCWRKASAAVIETAPLNAGDAAHAATSACSTASRRQPNRNRRTCPR